MPLYKKESVQLMLARDVQLFSLCCSPFVLLKEAVVIGRVNNEKTVSVWLLFNAAIAFEDKLISAGIGLSDA